MNLNRWQIFGLIAFVIIILPLLGGVVGYRAKECPAPDFSDAIRMRKELDSMMASEALIREENAVLRENSRRSDSIANIPVKVIYKRHEDRLSHSPDLDTLREIFVSGIKE